MSSYRYRGCPYCSYRGTGTNAHVSKRHPDKPRPSDKEFPGWRD